MRNEEWKADDVSDKHQLPEYDEATPPDLMGEDNGNLPVE